MTSDDHDTGAVDFNMPMTVGAIEEGGISNRFSDHNEHGMKIKELDDLSAPEKYIVQIAIQRSKIHTDNHVYSVNLPVVVNARKDYEDKIASRAGVKSPDARTRYILYHRAAKRLQDRGIATVEKADDGLLWISIQRKLLMDLAIASKQKIEGLRETTINLMRRFSEIPTNGISHDKPPKKDIFAIPKNASIERLEAIRMVRGMKTMMTKADRKDLASMFNRYDDRTTIKIITLLDQTSGDLVGAEYSTRFNDVKKAAISLTKFDAAHAKSFESYRKACFLTLTTDPKLFNCVWDANRHIGKAWNKFLSFLTKRHGSRPEYITAYEYTKKGMIHLHALVFVDFIAGFKDISKEWERCGQGSIQYVYQVVAKKINDEWCWKWARDRPEKTNTEHAGDYLKKYLRKATLSRYDKFEARGMVQALYWVFNKRFWSCSRRLLPEDAEEQTATEPIEDPENGFVFWKILDEDVADDLGVRIIYRRGEYGDSADQNDPPDSESAESEEVME